MGFVVVESLGDTDFDIPLVDCNCGFDTAPISFETGSEVSAHCVH